MEKLKIPLYSKIDELRTELSKNGIGKIGSWKKDELGWYSFTDYHSFGNTSSVNGMQNNIAYYINGRQKENANEVKIVLNINNDKETKKALELLNTISQKRTFSKHRKSKTKRIWKWYLSNFPRIR